MLPFVVSFCCSGFLVLEAMERWEQSYFLSFMQPSNKYKERTKERFVITVNAFHHTFGTAQFQLTSLCASNSEIFSTAVCFDCSACSFSVVRDSYRNKKQLSFPMYFLIDLWQQNNYSNPSSPSLVELSPVFVALACVRFAGNGNERKAEVRERKLLRSRFSVNCNRCLSLTGSSLVSTY